MQFVETNFLVYWLGITQDVQVTLLKIDYLFSSRVEDEGIPDIPLIGNLQIEATVADGNYINGQPRKMYLHNA